MNRAIAIFAGCATAAAMTATVWAAAENRPTDRRLSHLPIPTVPTIQSGSPVQQLIDTLVEEEQRADRASLIARGSAEIQGVSVPSADLPTGRREIARMRASMRMCFRRSLETSNRLGELTITATVKPDGYVSDLRWSNKGELPQGLIECALSRVRDAEFEVSGDRGGKIELTVAFRLQPPDVD